MDPLIQFFTYGADVLLIAASLGAALFCFILSRKLSRLTRIDNGLGGAIAVLSQQVDEMQKTLADTKNGSEGSAQRLEALNAEARDLMGELELVMSACENLAAADYLPEEEALLPDDEGGETVGLIEDAPTELVFGSRRNKTPQSEQTEIPFFLKRRSQLAEVGGA